MLPTVMLPCGPSKRTLRILPSSMGMGVMVVNVCAYLRLVLMVTPPALGLEQKDPKWRWEGNFLVNWCRSWCVPWVSCTSIISNWLKRDLKRVILCTAVWCIDQTLEKRALAFHETILQPRLKRLCTMVGLKLTGGGGDEGGTLKVESLSWWWSTGEGGRTWSELEVESASFAVV